MFSIRELHCVYVIVITVPPVIDMIVSLVIVTRVSIVTVMIVYLAIVMMVSLVIVMIEPEGAINDCISFHKTSQH